MYRAGYANKNDNHRLGKIIIFLIACTIGIIAWFYVLLVITPQPPQTTIYIYKGGV